MSTLATEFALIHSGCAALRTLRWFGSLQCGGNWRHGSIADGFVSVHCKALGSADTGTHALDIAVGDETDMTAVLGLGGTITAHELVVEFRISTTNLVGTYITRQTRAMVVLTIRFHEFANDGLFATFA